MASMEFVKPIEIDVDNICVADPGTLPSTEEYAKNVIFSGEEGKVYIRPFDELKITTITNVTLLMGIVMDMKRLYHSLPCMPYNSYTKDKKFSHGTITSVRMDGVYRGEPGGCFPNSVMINIWASTGNTNAQGQQICSKVSAKITQVKIQMCGVASYEMGLEISHEIVRQINQTLDMLVMLRSKPVQYSNLRQWISQNGCGQICNNPHSNLPMKHLINWNGLRTPPPDSLDIYRELLPHIYDQMFYEDLIEVLTYHTSADPGKISDYLQVRKIGLSMTNYNYMLGFKIDRQLLYEYLKASKLNVIYNNTKVSYILVRMTSRIPNGNSVIRRVEQNGRQTFMIQESGRIMHSGPETIQMATCYYKLMGMIATIRDQIASSIPSLHEFLSSSQKRRRGRRKKSDIANTPQIYNPYGQQTLLTINTDVQAHAVSEIQILSPSMYMMSTTSMTPQISSSSSMTPQMSNINQKPRNPCSINQTPGNPCSINQTPGNPCSINQTPGNPCSINQTPGNPCSINQTPNIGVNSMMTPEHKEYVHPTFVPNIVKMYNNDYCQIVEDEDEDDEDDESISIPNIPADEITSLLLSDITINTNRVILED